MEIVKLSSVAGGEEKSFLNTQQITEVKQKILGFLLIEGHFLPNFNGGGYMPKTDTLKPIFFLTELHFSDCKCKKG
jgi:hypothetical protein